jgi:hypothetical protein
MENIVKVVIAIVIVAVVAAFFSERYGWLTPVGKPVSTASTGGQICGYPKYTTDGRVEFNGKTYSDMSPRRNPTDLICSDGVHAVWKSQ